MRLSMFSLRLVVGFVNREGFAKQGENPDSCKRETGKMKDQEGEMEGGKMDRSAAE
jgi:hypothetical protein